MNCNRMFVMVFALCLMISNAVAAPTVKRLGGTSTYSSTSNITSGKVADTQKLSRASSVRSVSANIKPVTITKNVSEKTDSNITTSRLSIGKYLHNKGVASGVIKPNDSSAIIQSDTITNLTDRVVQLENQMDEKQQVLSAGNGIIIENDVISVDVAVNDLPDKVETITEQLDENYYTKTEIEQIIENQDIQNNDTVYDVATGERKYVSIVNDFNTGILN